MHSGLLLTLKEWHEWLNATPGSVPMPLRSLTALVVGLGLSACAEFPELDAALSDEARAAPYPTLLPVEDLNARVGEPRIAPDAADAIEARVARLKARAARLRNTVLDSPTRARLQAGIEEI